MNYKPSLVINKFPEPILNPFVMKPYYNQPFINPDDL
jgi:hypothetical protein